jgi:hypothetical protein
MEYGRDRIGSDEWTPEKFEAFRKLIEQAKIADVVLNQPHCEDPDKNKWFEAVRIKTNIVDQICRRQGLNFE